MSTPACLAGVWKTGKRPWFDILTSVPNNGLKTIWTYSNLQLQQSYLLTIICRRTVVWHDQRNCPIHKRQNKRVIWALELVHRIMNAGQDFLYGPCPAPGLHVFFQWNGTTAFTQSLTGFSNQHLKVLNSIVTVGLYFRLGGQHMHFHLGVADKVAVAARWTSFLDRFVPRIFLI